MFVADGKTKGNLFLPYSKGGRGFAGTERVLPALPPRARGGGVAWQSREHREELARAEPGTRSRASGFGTARAGRRMGRFPHAGRAGSTDTRKPARGSAGMT